MYSYNTLHSKNILIEILLCLLKFIYTHGKMDGNLYFIYNNAEHISAFLLIGFDE